MPPEADDKYRAFFESIDEGFCIMRLGLDAQERIVALVFDQVNACFERYTGIRNAVGRTLSELLPTLDESWSTICCRVRDTGRSERSESYLQNVDRWFRVRHSRLGGAGSHRVAVWLDEICDSTRSASGVREIEHCFPLVLSALPVAAAILDTRGVVLTANDAMRRFLPAGVPPSGTSRVRRWKAFHPDGSPLDSTDFPVARALRGEIVFPRLDMLYTQHDGQEIWTRVAAAPLRDASGQVTGVFSIVVDIDPLKRREEVALRREKRQGFLLRLSDSLGVLSDPISIQAEAAELLGHELNVQRVAFARLEGAHYVVDRDWMDGVPSMVGRHPLTSFDPAILPTLHNGSAVWSSDVETNPMLDAAHLAACAAMQTRAYIYAPLLKGGKLVALLIVSTVAPRTWTQDEVARVRGTAYRIWAAVQRAPAATVPGSEERFRQFADASSGVLAIRNAETLSLEYVSPACRNVYHVGEQAILGDVERWTRLMAAQDRTAALEHLRAAKNGPVIREFRMHRMDGGAPCWIRHTAFPLLDETGRARLIGSIAEDVTDAKRAVDSQSILVGELQHRVRNVMAVVRSMTALTAGQAQDVLEFTSLLMGRFLTLARVQKLLTRAANVGVTISTLLTEELSAQVQGRGHYEIAGPECTLPPRATEVLALVMHELIASALKYGALSSPGGHLTVHWSKVEKEGVSWLSLDWTERVVPERSDAISAPRRYSFVRELIEERIPYELSGLGYLALEESAVRCHIEFPLRNAASILETDVPGG